MKIWKHIQDLPACMTCWWMRRPTGSGVRMSYMSFKNMVSAMVCCLSWAAVRGHWRSFSPKRGMTWSAWTARRKCSILPVTRERSRGRISCIYGRICVPLSCMGRCGQWWVCATAWIICWRRRSWRHVFVWSAIILTPKGFSSLISTRDTSMRRWLATAWLRKTVRIAALSGRIISTRRAVSMSMIWQCLSKTGKGQSADRNFSLGFRRCISSGDIH